MSTPRVTVGLPVYNGERYLEETLQNWQAQDFEDYEFVVSQNGSTDRTAEILGDYAAKDPRIRVITREETLGAVQNYNSLVAEAKAPLFCWTADDDLRAPTFLSKLVGVLDERPEVVLAHGSSQVFYGDDSTNRKKKIYFKRPVGTEKSKIARVSSVLRFSKTWGNVYGVMRTEMLRKTHLAHSPMGLVADVGLMLEIACYGQFALVPEVLLLLRYHDQALHRTQDDPMYDGGRGRTIDEDVLKWVGELPLNEVEQKLFLRELYIWCRKATKPRPLHLRLHPMRAAWVKGARSMVDLKRWVNGV